jgi:hypothetical protein
VSAVWGFLGGVAGSLAVLACVYVVVVGKLRKSLGLGGSRRPRPATAAAPAPAQAPTQAELEALAVSMLHSADVETLKAAGLIADDK